MTPHSETVASTASTNDDVVARASEGAGEGYWLRAERQTGGKGRRGRGWQSPPGNLYASTIVRLRLGDPPPPSLAFVAALAMHRLVASALPTCEVMLKWPNDVLVGGAKICGILLERRDDAVIVGFGLNIASSPVIAGRATTSLREAGGAPALDAGALLVDLARHFADTLSRWRIDGLVPILAQWTERAHPVGTPLKLRLVENEDFECRFSGLTGDGALLVTDDKGAIREIRAADVELIKELD